MPPDQAIPAKATVVASAWRDALVRLGLVWVALILAFAGDWAMMVRHWWDSSTYNHILLVPPILVRQPMDRTDVSADGG